MPGFLAAGCGHRKLRVGPDRTRFETGFSEIQPGRTYPLRVFRRLENTTYSLDLPGEPCNNYPVQTGPVWGCGQLAEVRLQEGESLENALRRFKRKVQQEDIIKEVKRHSFYLKPGEKKRVKEALARKRSRKKARKEQD
jgi:small subunit ribosomal protein S21